MESGSRHPEFSPHYYIADHTYENMALYEEFIQLLQREVTRMKGHPGCVQRSHWLLQPRRGLRTFRLALGFAQ